MTSHGNQNITTETPEPTDGDEGVSQFDESIEISEDPLGRFDEFAGYSDEKDTLRRRVVTPADLDRYAASTVLLFEEDADSRANLLARGLTGEVDAAYTHYYVTSVSTNLSTDHSSVSAAFELARRNDPALVIIDCLDEYGFDAEEFEVLHQHLERNRTNSHRVTAVCIGTDRNLTEYESYFEAIIPVPEPGAQFRRGVIRRELADAIDNGVVDIETPADLALSEVTTDGLTPEQLRTAVKRSIQSSLAVSGDSHRVTLTAADVQESIDDISSETLPDMSTGGLFSGRDEDGQVTDPEVPDVTFADIGGLREEKRRIRRAATIPFNHRDTFRRAGFSAGQGVLVHGPPGTGKTMLAKAVANELNHCFFSVQGPEIESPLVGESERQLRDLFETARSYAPSVIFFDEFDALAPARGAEGAAFKNDLVNTLLAELDGLEPLEEIIVLAATNRVDALDDAVLRSGRFDTFIEVPMPDATARKEIFTQYAETLPTARPVTAEWFESQSPGNISGADIAAICRKSLEFAAARVERANTDRATVTREDVRRAIKNSSTGDESATSRGFR